MRGLNSEELECLKNCAPSESSDDSLSDSESEICEQLARRGLMSTWFEVSLTDSDWEDKWYETNATGMMLLQVYKSLSFTV